MGIRRLGLVPFRRLTAACLRRQADGVNQQGLQTMAMMGGAGGMGSQGILPVVIRDKQTLYQSYMSFVKGGGLFVPTNKRYNLGDEVFLLMTLPEETERVATTGRVVWITPIAAQGNRPAGTGVQFAENADGDNARTKIETLLAGLQGGDKPTHTM
jgi:type IV pilus assembly protein PilZ